MSKAWCVKKTDFWANHEHKLTAVIPPGIYEGGSKPDIGVFLRKVELQHDGLIPLPGSVAESVLAEIMRFWELRDRFLERSLVHKRGVLLHGKPGAGKTATVVQLADMVVEKAGGIVLSGMRSPAFLSHCLKMVRSAETDRPVMVMLEDLDYLLERGDESEWLALLDGEESVNGIVYVATTNYLHKLPPRIRCRPSRFDLVVEIGPPSEADRRAYLAAKEPMTSERRREQWVELTDGMSFAHLKELCVLCGIYGVSAPDAAIRLRGMMSAAVED